MEPRVSSLLSKHSAPVVFTFILPNLPKSGLVYGDGAGIAQVDLNDYTNGHFPCLLHLPTLGMLQEARLRAKVARVFYGLPLKQIKPFQEPCQAGLG